MSKEKLQKIKNYFIRNKKIYRHVVILTFLLVIYIGFCACVSNSAFLKINKYINSSDTGQVVGEIKNGDVITQKIQNISGTIYSIGFRSATYGEKNAGNGQMLISLYDEKTGQLIGQVSDEMSKITDNVYFRFIFDEKIVIDNETDIIVKAEIKGMQPEDKFTVYLAAGTENEAMKLNGKTINGTLEILMEKSENDYFAKAVVFSMVILGLFIVAMYYLIFIRKNVKIELLYLVCAVALGGLFFVFIPEFETPDEQRHIHTAYNVSNMILGYKYDDDIEMRVIDYEQRFLADRFDRNRYNEYVGQLIRGYGVDNDETVMLGNTPLGVQKYLYFVSGVGITIGRLLSFGTVPTYFLGSLLNYIFFVLVMFYSIKKIPIGKVAVLLIAILPMTLQQATSYSYDCVVISMGTLLVALSLKIAYSDKNKKSEIAILIGTMLLFIPVKSCAYSMLALIVLIPIRKLWKKERKTSRILLTGLVFSYCAVIIPIIFNFLFPSEDAGMMSGYIEWANEPGYTIGQLLSNPKRCLNIIYSTILTNISYYIHTMVGGYLGWLVIPIPWFVTLILLTTLFISIMKTEDDNINISTKSRCLLGSVCIISICFVMAGLLFSWTPASYTVIQGVQGRYFIPILLLMLLAVRGNWMTIKRNVPKYCVFATVLVQPYIIYSIIIYMK